MNFKLRTYVCVLPGDNDNPCSMFGTGIGYKGIESAAIALVVLIPFLTSRFLFFGLLFGTL